MQIVWFTFVLFICHTFSYFSWNVAAFFVCLNQFPQLKCYVTNLPPHVKHRDVVFCQFLMPAKFRVKRFALQYCFQLIYVGLKQARQEGLVEDHLAKSLKNWIRNIWRILTKAKKIIFRRSETTNMKTFLSKSGQTWDQSFQSSAIGLNKIPSIVHLFGTLQLYCRKLL